jgi:hypothetical protein
MAGNGSCVQFFCDIFHGGCCDIFASGKATTNTAFTLLIQEASVGFGGHWNEREPWTNSNIKVSFFVCFQFLFSIP